MNEKLLKRLAGHVDPRSRQGIYSRGSNVYNGGSSHAHSGPGSVSGRPPNNLAAAIQRRRAKLQAKAQGKM